MINYDPQKLYQEYKGRFKSMTDEQLIAAFNNEVRNSGWTSARASYLATLHEEFENRSYDYSDIGDKKQLSFAKKIKLLGKKIMIDEI